MMNTTPDLPPIYKLADPIFSQCLDKVRSLVFFDYGDIFLFDKEEKTVEMLAYKTKDRPAGMGCPDSKVLRLSMTQGITGWVANTGKSMLIPEVDQLYETYPDCKAQYYPYWDAARSELAVPVLWEGSVVGVINLERQEDHFREEDEHRVTQFVAGEIAQLMASAARQFNRYRQALRREQKRSEQLSNLMKLARHTLRLDMVSAQHSFMTKLLSVFPEFSVCNIFLFDKAAEELLFAGINEHLHFPEGYSEFGYRLCKGQSVAYDEVIEPRAKHHYVKDIQTHDHFQWKEFARKYGLEKMVCLLLPGDDDSPLGCFMFFTQDKNYAFPEPDSPDEKLFEDLAAFIADVFRVQTQQLIQSAREKIAEICSCDPLSYKTMNEVAHVAREMTGTNGCSVFLAERGSQKEEPVLRLKGTTGLQYQEAPGSWVALDEARYPTVVYPDDTGKTGYVTWEGDAVRLDSESLQEQAPDQFPEKPRILETPLKSQGRLLGTIRVNAKVDSKGYTLPFTPLHRELLQVIGDQIVSALLRAEVEENDRAHRMRLKLWDDFVDTLVTIKYGKEALDQYLHDLLKRMIMDLHCDTGSFAMYAPEDNALHFQHFLVSQGTDAERQHYENKARRSPRPLGKSLMGEAYTSQKTLNWPDMHNSEYRERFGIQSVHPEARACLAVPVSFGDHRYGVMALASFSPGYFTERHEKTIQRAAYLGALYIFVRSLLQEKDDFMATIAHQLVAPLASLEKSCARLLRSELSEDSHRRLLAHIQDTATLALHIAHNYKAVRRWLHTSAESKITARPVEISDLVTAIADLFRSVAYQNSILIEDQTESQALHVLADENLLKHVLINLLDNAVKYSNPNTDIRVCLQRSDDGYGVVRIHNIGPFINQEECKQIFDFGYRGASAHIRNTTGTGIGLTVAEAIVQAHCGQLSVNSHMPNGKKGEANIEFVLKIPLEPGS